MDVHNPGVGARVRSSQRAVWRSQYPDEAITRNCVARGMRGGLFCLIAIRAWRAYGIDPVTYPCFLLPPTIEELEAIEDKVHLTSLIRDLDIRGTTPRIRALIRSTVEPEWSWLGEIVQDHLEIVEEGHVP